MKGPDVPALAAAEAWRVLALLDGDVAPVEHAPSSTWAALSHLAGSPPETWRTALSERCMVVSCWANPRALEDLDSAPGRVLFSARAVPGDPLDVYVDVDAWLWLQERTLIGPEARGPVNLVARFPQVPWPFATADVFRAARWADELDSVEADVARVAAERLSAAASALLARRVG